MRALVGALSDAAFSAASRCGLQRKLVYVLFIISMTFALIALAAPWFLHRSVLATGAHNAQSHEAWVASLAMSVFLLLGAGTTTHFFRMFWSAASRNGLVVVAAALMTLGGAFVTLALMLDGTSEFTSSRLGRTGINMIAWTVIDYIFLQRVSIINRTSKRAGCGQQRVQIGFYVVAAFTIIFVPLFNATNLRVGLIASLGLPMQLSSVGLQLSKAVFYVFVMEQLLRPLVELSKVRRSTWGVQRREILNQMYRVAFIEFLAAAMNFMLLFYGFVLWRFFKGLFWTVVPSICYINCVSLLLLSGSFHRLSKMEACSQEAEHLREQRREAAASAYKTCDDPGWQEQVEDMATRAFTLEQLLLFYRRLPEVMPHFDPVCHTTTDVVRGAIIPDTADIQDAYAKKMMGGQLTWPDVMVTHNWGNLFRDLCAAMVAHALGEPDFEFIAHLLNNFDLDRIEEMLTLEDLQRTYWVCAFCVNQHRSICGSNPQETLDPVTGHRHDVCACGAIKYYNDSEPLRDDGKSVKCEMNKFDDMLSYLAATDPAFGHVVAVDRGFALFSRAWCVAELAAGHKLGVQQTVMVLSRKALEEKRATLASLNIQDMQAARAEDVAEILGNIPDVDAFNQHMRQMLVGKLGLLVLWTGMDEFRMGARLGQMCQMATVLEEVLNDELDAGQLSTTPSSVLSKLENFQRVVTDRIRISGLGAKSEDKDGEEAATVASQDHIQQTEVVIPRDVSSQTVLEVTTTLAASSLAVFHGKGCEQSQATDEVAAAEDVPRLLSL
eukprot:TRINITY_DN22225_c0_g1_i2.p1 TRINITY_DN22225_c0_g1~~TRINITY_DN22225_c0_g1_i2.p1  ORF type:complete len:779 (+),score=114.59 TRINITY_DN22225_c0_g1_i2:125-2461(+)